MGFLSGIFMIAMAGILADVVVKVARARAGTAGSAGLKAQIGDLQRLVEEQADQVANQSQRLSELEERCDFTERLLAQTRERASLAGDRPPPERAP